jgi:hypothetical protein
MPRDPKAKNSLSLVGIYEPNSHQSIAGKFVNLPLRKSDKLDLNLG